MFGIKARLPYKQGNSVVFSACTARGSTQAMQKFS